MKRWPPLLLIALLLQASCQNDDTASRAPVITGGNPQRGKVIMSSYGCTSCHTIPGIAGANALVGPPLDHMASRTYIAGVMTNTPSHMITWIQDPPGVDNKTAMPNLRVTEPDARDIAAYLYTLK